MNAYSTSRRHGRLLRGALAAVLLVALMAFAPSGAVAEASNDDIPTAYTIASGQSIDATVTGSFTGAHQVFKVALTTGQVLSVTGAFGGDPSAAATLKIFGPDAHSVTTDTPLATTAGTPLEQFSVQETATADGTYYIDLQYSYAAMIAMHFFVNVSGGPITPDVSFEPTELGFDAAAGQAPPVSQTVTITIGGWSAPEVEWYLYNLPSWLSIEPTGGTAPGVTVMEISVDTSGLAIGSYDASVQVGVNMPPVGPTGVRAMGGQTSYGQLPVNLTVGTGGAKLDACINGFSLSPTYPARTGSSLPRATISGSLDSSGGVVSTGTVLASQPVAILRSYDNVTYTRVATATTDANGDFLIALSVPTKAYFKAEFLGNDFLNASALTSARGCLPYAYVKTPSTPSYVYLNRRFVTSGYIYPGHNSTYPVKLYFYRWQRRSNGTYGWVYKRWVYGKRISGSASTAYAKYSVSTYLTARGKWAVKAVHADGDHKSSTSGVRVFYVK